MSNTLMQLLPLVGVFLLGVLLRRFGVLEERQSSWLLRLVFYIGLPVVIFLAVVKIEVDESLIPLAIFPPIVMLITIAATLFLRRSLLKKVNLKTFAAIVAGAAIMNQSFVIPFVASTYGAEGLARIAIIDSFNAIMIFSLLYTAIAALGHKKPKFGPIAVHVLTAPTLIALVLGIVFKLNGGQLSADIMLMFVPVAVSVSLVLLLALGIKFKPHLKKPPLFLIEVGLRFVLGAIIGICFIKLCGLHGLDAQIIMIVSTAPIGLNSITLAEVEKLDVEFAVSAVSAGLIIGLIVTPFMIHFVQTVNW